MRNTSTRQRYLWAAVLGLKDAGLSPCEIGEVLGILPGRVAQLYDSKKAEEFRRHVPETSRAHLRAEDSLLCLRVHLDIGQLQTSVSAAELEETAARLRALIETEQQARAADGWTARSAELTDARRVLAAWDALTRTHYQEVPR